MSTDHDTANALSHDGLGFALNSALSGRPARFPKTIRYQNDSSPFRIDATLGQWRIDESGQGNRIEIAIASGTLRDIDIEQNAEFQAPKIILFANRMAWRCRGA